MSTINQKIRLRRQQLHYTLEDLARHSGYTKGYLSRIENADTPPPFATVERIATALDIDLAELVEQETEKTYSANIDLVSTAERAAVSWNNPGAQYTFKPLIKSYKNKYMAPFLFRVLSGATELTSHDSEEFVYVLEGSVILHYEGKSYKLNKGDSFYLYSRLQHYFENKQAEPALLLAVHYNYRRF